MSDAVDEQILGLRSRFWSERDPDGRAFAPLADAYRRAGDLDEALELLEDGVDRLPDFTPGWVVSGRVHRDRGELEAAEEAFRRVLELDPENVVALRALGELAEEAGRPDEALERFRRLRTQGAADPDLEERIEALQGGQSGPKEAAEPEEAAEPTVAEDGQVAEDVVTATMAELYVRQGLTEKAADVYRRLLEREPESERFRARLDELEEEMRTRPSGASGLDRVERADEDAESLAEGMGPEPGDADEIETPFAWEEEAREGGREGVGAAAVAGPVDPSDTLGRYFDVLLSWVPGAVPIESLAPDGVVPIESLAPDDGGEGERPRPVVPIESLAPDG